MTRKLSASNQIEVRFNEVDSYNIVWHGNYAAYFESGRQAFSNKYGLGQKEMMEEGFYLPLTKLDFEFKSPLLYNDRVNVITSYRDCFEARLLFDYEVYRISDDKLVCRGTSEQAIVGLDWKIRIFPPPYLVGWKKKWLVEETVNNHID